MFPAAGHIALAIEAARQHCEITGVNMSGAVLRDVELKTALIIPDTDTGIEIQLRLAQNSSSKSLRTISPWSLAPTTTGLFTPMARFFQSLALNQRTCAPTL